MSDQGNYFNAPENRCRMPWNILTGPIQEFNMWIETHRNHIEGEEIFQLRAFRHLIFHSILNRNR